MRLNFPGVTSAVVLSLTALIVISGCKSENTLPPSPTSLINGTRDRLNPFRLTLTTDPASPNIRSRITLKAHIIDAANQPADGVTVEADLSMMGGGGSQHLTLSGVGNGDYESDLTVDTPGSWDVDVSATRDDKSSKQRLTIEVGG